MKTTMKQLAAGTILALLLMAVNVHAEGRENTNASSLETIEATETTMQLENWMIDNYFWSGSSAINSEEAIDESLNLENWMISDVNWMNPQEMNVKIEKDSELEIENWMTDTTVWNR